MRDQLLDPELLSRLAHLSILSPRRVSGAIVGRHRSHTHGSSIEFAEHKEYAPGDELRHMDWRAYGRVDKYYIKRYEDETNLRTFVEHLEHHGDTENVVHKHFWAPTTSFAVRSARVSAARSVVARSN